MAIDVSTELTEALQELAQASVDLLDAAKSSDRGRHREATKEWLAAQQRRREVWRAMATPSPAGDGQNNQ